MKASDLNRFIMGMSVSDALKTSISEEVFAYSKLMEKRGSTIPLLFNEDEAVNLDNQALKTLLQATLSGRISNVELAYICDCLTLGEKVQIKNEEVEEIIFEIADPEINGFKSVIELEEIISCLRKI